MGRVLLCRTPVAAPALEFSLFPPGQKVLFVEGREGSNDAFDLELDFTLVEHREAQITSSLCYLAQLLRRTNYGGKEELNFLPSGKGSQAIQRMSVWLSTPYLPQLLLWPL